MARSKPATTAAMRQDHEQTTAVDPRPTWRPSAEGSEIAAAHQQITELPALGYPISEDAVSFWFEQTFKRTPEPAEVVAVLDAMVRRDAAQPASDPPGKRVFHER